MQKQNNIRKKPKVTKIVILIAIIIQLLLSTYISCILVFYGPFTSLRKMIVGTAMSSYNHQYIAKIFLSDAEIAEILKVNTTSAVQNILEVKIQNNNDNGIDEYTIDGKQFKGYLLIIKNPLRVKVGYSNKLTEQGETTSDIAKDNNAVAAINGGGFTDKSSSGKLWAGTGAFPTYFLMTGGKLIYQDFPAYKKTNVVALDNSGKLIIGNHSINELKALNVDEAIAFGPSLVLNGSPAFSGDGGQGITARTSIGQKKDGSILLLVLDGRKLNMPGATLHDEQKIMRDYGAYNAANLDGGSSTTMYFNGKIINSPCDPLGERSVATAIYVKQ
jgi:exopolysaccharide biosynthesis protein